MAATEFKDRLAFDLASGEILDATRRYLLLRHDTFMGIFTRLSAPARREALAALEDAVFEHGSDSARAYRDSGAGTARDLVDIIERTAPQLGWGRWLFKIEPGCLRLEVRNSPFAIGYGPTTEPVCHAIKGMLRAVAELTLSTVCEVRESTCFACDGNDCSFAARPTSDA